jgi:hypothetical protein
VRSRNDLGERGEYVDCFRDELSGLYALLKVFLLVGDEAESVSSRRLVDPLPKVTEGAPVVFNESLGRLQGDGRFEFRSCDLEEWL